MFVCNTLAFNAADSDSDIDVLIIARFGRMWIARLWTTTILSLYRLRRTKKKIADRICLSFYLADRTLNLSKFRIAPDDIYLSYWLRTLIPVYDPDSLGESMTRANQDLLAPFFDRARHYTPAFVSPQKYVNKNFIARFFEMVLSGSFGSTVEKFARSFQRRKIMHNSKSLVHAKDTRVVVNDSMFKFHGNDRRALYRDLWKKRVKEMGIPNYSNCPNCSKEFNFCMSTRFVSFERLLVYLWAIVFPWQTVWIYRAAFLNGSVWQYGTLGLYLSEGILWLLCVVGILNIWCVLAWLS